MKIKEILELSMTKTMAVIAKDHLTIGEKALRTTLKEIGCTHQNGKKGWIYTGDVPDILERSIYEFVPSRQTRQRQASKKPNASIEKAHTSNLKANEIKLKASTKQVISEPDSIDKLLMRNEKESNERIYRGFYWDRDIIHFLDNVKHGNKSDLMNEIVRTVLKEKGLI